MPTHGHSAYSKDGDTAHKHNQHPQLFILPVSMMVMSQQGLAYIKDGEIGHFGTLIAAQAESNMALMNLSLKCNVSPGIWSPIYSKLPKN